MIALPSHLPAIVIGDRAMTDYQPEWLEDEVLEAAARAGHDRWWFARDIALSVWLYLRERCQSGVVTLPQIAGKLRQALAAVGFESVGRELSLNPPPVRLSLVEIARESRNGFELHFFELLRRKLRDGLEVPRAEVRVSGLRPAVKLLRGSHRWSERCERLEAEVLAFLKTAVEREGGRHVRVLIR